MIERTVITLLIAILSSPALANPPDPYEPDPYGPYSTDPNEPTRPEDAKTTFDRLQSNAVLFDYEMSGELDNQVGQCHGQALVKTGYFYDSLCAVWKLQSQTCSGKSQDVDWLHDELTNNDKYSRACDGYPLDSRELPGLGYCVPELIQKTQEISRITLSCSWECRVKEFPCAGFATYTFTKMKARSEPSRPARKKVSDKIENRK